MLDGVKAAALLVVVVAASGCDMGALVQGVLSRNDFSIASREPVATHNRQGLDVVVVLSEVQGEQLFFPSAAAPRA